MTSVAQVDRLGHLRAAKDLLDRAYAQPLDLDALAARAGYSRYHFARTFRDAFGDTPRRYLTRRRVERAVRLSGPPPIPGCFVLMWGGAAAPGGLRVDR